MAGPTNRQVASEACVHPGGCQRHKLARDEAVLTLGVKGGFTF